MRMRLVSLCVYAAFVFSGHSPAAFGQQEKCFQLAQNGVKYGTWDTIRVYFLSLNLGDETKKERSRLLKLRAQIIDLESQKQRLIEIINIHLSGNVSGTVASSQLSLTDIPRVLGQIDTVSQELADISQTGSLFAAEKAFKDLKLNLDEKRAFTLCLLAQQTVSTDPDRSKMAELVESLRSELKAISDAEEALGDYIKKISR